MIQQITFYTHVHTHRKITKIFEQENYKVVSIYDTYDILWYRFLQLVNMVLLLISILIIVNDKETEPHPMRLHEIVARYFVAKSKVINHLICLFILCYIYHNAQAILCIMHIKVCLEFVYLTVVVFTQSIDPWFIFKSISHLKYYWILVK